MIKLKIEYCRKEGRPDYGSEGASCGLELEVDGALLENLADLHAKIAGVYEECRAAVDEQLRGRPVAPPVAPPAPIAPPAPVPPASPKSPASPKKNGYGAPRTTKQFLGWFGSLDNPTRDMVKAIARQRHLSTLFKEWSDEDAVTVYELVQAGANVGPESDHERFMRRLAEAKREDKAREAAFAHATGR